MSTNHLSNDSFIGRHIGPDSEETAEMLSKLGFSNINELIEAVVPPHIRLKEPVDVQAPVSENQFLKDFKKLASKNKVFRSYIGTGYYGTITPPVILRNVLENPGWYTAYTPYQAEIAQGRLEALINFQTMVANLVGMEIANASLLDEATAAAEAMTMLYAARKSDKKGADVFLVADHVHPQTIDVLKTRSEPLGIKLRILAVEKFDIADASVYGLIVQNPASDGKVHDLEPLLQAAKEQHVFSVVATDLLASVIMKPAGEMGADVVVGVSQRFGVPFGFGGPHAAFFATKDEFKRQLPGRIIGQSIDAQKKPAYRMALQTREQHIRREKATSNICTAQVLLAVISSFYAAYHGPQGLQYIAEQVHDNTTMLAQNLQDKGFELVHAEFFDTIRVSTSHTKAIQQKAEESGINFRYFTNGDIGISLDETVSTEDLADIMSVFASFVDSNIAKSLVGIDVSLKRNSEILPQQVFNKYHSEAEMTRYIRFLENKDLSLVHSMISLGSCTMKLNATAEMIPVTWPELGNIHPFVPANQSLGYAEMIVNLKRWLSTITGFAGISLQPNSGAQGEYTGLMVIRAYHIDHGDAHRNIALIPSSAHGTNPASAVMAGMQVVVVKCDEKGNIDEADLKAKAELHAPNLSCLMVTYPSTHGVFEESIQEICAIVHKYGGLVYMDGANMNAQVGLTSPGNIGADVCHLNLHKTFCIPHGGGGPGMGPIGVVEKLVPYLPGHVFAHDNTEKSIHAVSAAPYGSASILAISYAYICMMGGEGITKATKFAILNANYMKARLEQEFPILYTGSSGYCAHEMILDFRPFKVAGIEVEDVAKRLMDYGFHAPTVSFPVAGTLMIEPTESEPKDEMDRFCDALLSIREEIREVENGVFSKDNNVLKHAPHTAEVVISDSWDRPYSREKAAFPMEYVRRAKFWPSVSRIDSAYGDRNLVCTCDPIEAYMSQEELA
jgi:glycine dehydrogenase